MSKNYLYCRVSTDDKNQEFDRQINIAKNYAKANDLDFCDTFCEKISGGVKATNRNEFNKLFELLNEGDTIYVSETSRLGRNYIDCFEMIDIITIEKKCNIVFISNGITLNGNGKLDPYKWLALSQMMIFDEFQKRQIGYMTAKGLQAKKANGVVLGRKELMCDERKQQFSIDYLNGMKFKDLATKYEMTEQSARNYVSKLGLPSRNKKRGE